MQRIFMGCLLSSSDCSRNRNFVRMMSVVLFLCAVFVAVPIAGQAHEDDPTQSHSDENTALQADTSKQVDDSGTEETEATSHVDHEGDHEENNKALLRKLFPGLSGAQDVHPMFVHFPIALVFTAFFFAVLSWFGRSAQFIRTARWLFWLSLVALPVTALTGFIAVGGWGDGHAVGHRNWMILTLVSAYLLFGVTRWVADRDRLYRIVLTVGLLIVCVFMTLGADRGSWLVYVEGAGVNSPEQVHNH